MIKKWKLVPMGTDKMSQSGQTSTYKISPEDII